MATRAHILEAARGWVGTKYVHQGRSKALGVDCVGLFVGICQEIGVELNDTPELRRYSRQPKRNQPKLLDQLGTLCGEPLASVTELQNADLVVFWFNWETHEPQHVALWTGETIIHSYTSIGRVVEHGLNDWWRERFVCGFRFPGATD